MKDIRVRIAPSPTGEDLHIGNAYTALINYIYAKKNNGRFIVRIEDTDRTRLVLQAEQRILASLRWLQLNYDEGPDIGGSYEPYKQSERLALYKKYTLELISKGKAYYCYCTPERLEKMREAQREQGQPTLYDGKCKENQTEKPQKDNYVIRLNVPEEGITKFYDLIRGEIAFENTLIDDQVLLKSDGYPTYHLGVVIDDYSMKISHVIRGEEWISSVPKHILLYEAFGWEKPVFAHLPLLRNPDKSKLSKRKNPVWVSWYKEQGILPEALTNYLALMGWSMPDGRDKFSLKELISSFRLEDIKTSAPIFNFEKLKWLNKKYIQEQPAAHFFENVAEASIYTPDTKDTRKFQEFKQTVVAVANIVKPRISTFKEYDDLAGFLHQRPDKYEVDMKQHKELLARMFKTLGSIGTDSWKAEEIGKILQDLCASLQMKAGDFFMILRIAITGKKISPPLNESMEILGKKEVISRLSKLVKLD